MASWFEMRRHEDCSNWHDRSATLLTMRDRSSPSGSGGARGGRDRPAQKRARTASAALCQREHRGPSLLCTVTVTLEPEILLTQPTREDGMSEYFRGPTCFDSP